MRMSRSSSSGSLGWLCFFILRVACAQQQEAPANSELTVRTTSSADIQVCAPPGVLSDRRPALQTLCLAQLRYLLSQTTAVYLVRTSTTALGAVCWVYVYQAPSPAAAANAEFLLSQQTGLGRLTLTDDLDGQPYACTTHVVPWQGEAPPLSPLWDISASDLILYGQPYACTTHVVPWQGEAPPLSPLWDISASDLILYGAIVGGGLALLLLVLCAFVLAAQSADAQQLKRYNNNNHRRQRSQRHSHQDEKLHHHSKPPPPLPHDDVEAEA